MQPCAGCQRTIDPAFDSVVHDNIGRAWHTLCMTRARGATDTEDRVRGAGPLWAWAIVTLLLPIVGLIVGLVYLFRNRIGPGLALIIEAAVLFAIYFVLLASASAATFTGPRAQWVTWVQAVSKAPGPKGEIALKSGECPSTPALGCADVDGGVLWLATNRRFVITHELGHFFDARNLDDQGRDELKFLFGLPADEPWVNPKVFGDACGGGDCPNEMFADAYANCALGRSPAGRRHAHGRMTGGWESPYGYAPSVKTHRMVCATIRAYR